MINEIIKAWDDGTCIGYGRGRFDNYCVYMKENGVVRAPKDVDYFTQIKELANKYSAELVYLHMCVLAKIARKKQLDVAAFTTLEILPRPYHTEDQLRVNKLFYTLFLTMLAEEFKEGTKLGAFIKMVALHELLMKGRCIEDTANFMKGMCSGDIAEMALEKGLLEQIEAAVENCGFYFFSSK